MENMDKTRRRMKAADRQDIPVGGDFFDRLHDKIMAEVEKTEMAPPPMMMKQKNYLRAHWRGWLYSSGSLAALAFVAGILSSQVSQVNETMQRVGLLSDGHERIVAEAMLSPESFSQTLINSQTEADFFVDVANESFENLTVAKLNKKLLGDRITR